MMIKKFRNILLLPALVMGAALTQGQAADSTSASTPASTQAGTRAEAPVILVVDQRHAIFGSKAGISITEQLKTLQNTTNKELEQIIAMVKKEVEGLEGQKAKLSKDEYAQYEQMVATRQKNLPVLREVKLRELRLSEESAVAKVAQELAPILKKIVDTHGATLLLDRANVMFAASTVDVTSEVIAELNKAIKTVKVERVSLMENKNTKK